MNRVEAVTGKLGAVAERMEFERGPISLMGLFFREDGDDSWDLLLAADWLRGGELESLRSVIRYLRESLDTRECLSISRIVILDYSEATHLALVSRFGGRLGWQDAHFVTEGGAVIRRAFIVIARPPDSIPRKSPPAVQWTPGAVMDDWRLFGPKTKIVVEAGRTGDVEGSDVSVQVGGATSATTAPPKGTSFTMANTAGVLHTTEFKTPSTSPVVPVESVGSGGFDSLVLHPK